MKPSITFSRILISIIALASLDMPFAYAKPPVIGYNQGIYHQISNGICPEGMQHAVAILAGGCAALPGITFENNLKNTYCDITPSVSIVLKSASAVVGAYSLYKTNQLLSKRTPAAIFAQKEVLLKKINKLSKDGNFTNQTVIEALTIKFAEQAGQGILVLIKKYVTQLINDISWINEKLKALNVPIIDQSKVTILKNARAEIISKNFFRSDLDLHKKYSEHEYNNRLNTKAKYMSWWLIKNGIKVSIKGSWFLTKTAASMCWDTFKIVLQSVVNKT